MGAETLIPQNAGGDSEIIELPETTFDDGTGIQRRDGAAIGEVRFGVRSILRLVRLEDGPDDTISQLRSDYALQLGRRLTLREIILSEEYFKAEDLAGQN